MHLDQDDDDDDSELEEELFGLWLAPLLDAVAPVHLDPQAKTPRDLAFEARHQRDRDALDELLPPGLAAFAKTLPPSGGASYAAKYQLGADGLGPAGRLDLPE